MTTARRDAALAIMAKTGILKSNYYPPIVHLLWRMGIAIPLPHFVSFERVALISGSFFGTAWGMLMSLTVWANNFKPAAAVLASLAAGAVFGVSLAAYYAYGRRKHKLPLWHELPGN